VRNQDRSADFCKGCEKECSAVGIENVREHVAGIDHRAPLVDGREVTYVNFDNAATTPPFMSVVHCLTRFFQLYSSVHRGTGFKSLLSTHVYERCRGVIADFTGADLSSRTLIFVQNATHALNKLAMRFCMADGSMVLCTLAEHHSNMLPWRKRGCLVEYVRVNRQDGTLDMADLEDKVRRNAGRLRLVTVTGASNVTGVMPPIRRIARLAHEAGAMIALDATQLVPHRPFKMGEPEDPERIDFVAFSAHKMYAPFGSGVLVGPRWVFERGVPDMVGGGTISAVTVDDVIWADPPEREEAGTPNAPGVLALAIAMRTLRSIGMENLAEHERALTRRLLSRLTQIDGIRLFGPRDPELREDRLGVVPFLVEGLSHGELAAILSYEWGIGVRNGCFCAQPYVRELLGISDRQMLEAVKKLAAGDHSGAPGLVRASIAVYNTADEVDYLLEALQSIVRDGPRARYVIDKEHGDYVPERPAFRLERYAPF